MRNISVAYRNAERSHSDWSKSPLYGHLTRHRGNLWIERLTKKENHLSKKRIIYQLPSCSLAFDEMAVLSQHDVLALCLCNLSCNFCVQPEPIVKFLTQFLKNLNPMIGFHVRFNLNIKPNVELQKPFAPDLNPNVGFHIRFNADLNPNVGFHRRFNPDLNPNVGFRKTFCPNLNPNVGFRNSRKPESEPKYFPFGPEIAKIRPNHFRNTDPNHILAF